MTRAAIISTTINPMPNMESWLTHMSPRDVMIIAGDHKTPHAEIERMARRAREEYDLDVTYVRPEAQGRWLSSEVLPWNCIQRRNIAILEAIDRTPEFIITIDDDNYPMTDVTHIGMSWVDQVEWVLMRPHDVVVGSSNTGWFNPGELCRPRVTHRGFPFGRRHEETELGLSFNAGNPTVGVFAGLWYGDPDIDAIERVVSQPDIKMIEQVNVTLAPGTWAPFNSQSTAYRTELAPLMMCLPHVGRMDDIWASYVARAVMDHIGWLVQYGSPTVRQDRNPHDLFRDIQAEMLGYEHTQHLCDVLRGIELPATSHVDELLTYVTSHLTALPYVPVGTLNAYDAWSDDIMQLDDRHAAARLFDTSKMGNDNDE